MPRVGCLPLLVLLIAAVVWRSHAAGSGDVCSMQDCSACPNGMFCSSDSSASNDSSSAQCSTCHTECNECYGPSDNQCFNCTNLYMSLGMLTFEPCQNASSNNRLLCVSQCPSNTVQSGMECVCRNGTFLMGTECVPCVDGCTKCVNNTQAGCLVCPLRQQGVCVAECTNGTKPGGSLCTVPLLPFDDYWVYVIIGGGAGLILLVTIVCLTCVLCCCCCRRRRRKKHRLVNSDSVLRQNVDDGHGTMSASFRLVPQSNTANRWRRSDRIDAKISQTSMEDQVYLQSVNKSLDPYSAQSTSTSNGNSQSSHTPSEPQERERLESAYVKMIGVKSDDMTQQLLTSPLPPHLPSGRTHSDVPPSNHKQFSENRTNNTMPVGRVTVATNFGDQDEEDQEEYIDPRELRDKSEEDYYYNHEFVDQYRRDEASQQETYEVPRELGYGDNPTVPPRGVVCAPNSSQTAEDEPHERHDTLDNEYVHMKPQVIQEDDGHSYINVPSRKAGRSITMPQIQTPPPADDEDDDRPEYYNIHHHRSQPTEDMYSNLS